MTVLIDSNGVLPFIWSIGCVTGVGASFFVAALAFLLLAEGVFGEIIRNDAKIRYKVLEYLLFGNFFELTLCVLFNGISDCCR